MVLAISGSMKMGRSNLGTSPFPDGNNGWATRQKQFCCRAYLSTGDDG